MPNRVQPWDPIDTFDLAWRGGLRLRGRRVRRLSGPRLQSLGSVSKTERSGWPSPPKRTLEALALILAAVVLCYLMVVGSRLAIVAGG